uniref:Uncharacterized protein n=1 Tax=Paramormyrops kingsleyae TaxID=1676925 RepID=A0A3B3T2I8_9TELE
PGCTPASCPHDGGLWYLRTAKLAVAVAIIRSRPKGWTGREHAEFLASRLHCEDNDWKAKAQGLQEEVLRLRQELLLSKTRAEITGSSVAGGYMDQPPGCILYTGSGFMHNTGDPPMDGRSQAAEESMRISGPWEGDSAMLHHTQFLHSLVGLGQPADSRDLPVVTDALCQLLSCMVEAWADPRLLPPPSLILRAAWVVAQALEFLSGPACVELVGRAESCLKELTALLLGNTRLNWVRTAALTHSVRCLLICTPSLSNSCLLICTPSLSNSCLLICTPSLSNSCLLICTPSL